MINGARYMPAWHIGQVLSNPRPWQLLARLLTFLSPFLCQGIFKHLQSIPDDADGTGILAASTGDHA